MPSDWVSRWLWRKGKQNVLVPLKEEEEQNATASLRHQPFQDSQQSDLGFWNPSLRSGLWLALRL